VKVNGNTNSIVLYSTNTWLAYNIAERYYKGEHYVWCTPYFDSKEVPKQKYTVAPTSAPKDIYINLYKEVERGDKHSTKIEDNKVGILKGAALKKEAGVISDQQQKEITAIVAAAERRDFKPLLYIIPYSLVTDVLRDVPVNERAHPLSVEYIIEALPNSFFDVIEIVWS
jgi:hypothetical protein